MDSRLYKAITSGDIDGFRRLIANDGNILLQRTQALNNTTLHVAVQFDREVCVREILNRFPLLPLQENLNGDTPLHIAAMLGLSNIVDLIIRSVKGEPSTTTLQQLVRMTNNENDTALHEAVRYHRYEVVRSLTEADPRFEYFPNNAGETPLYLAAEAGLSEYVRKILRTCPTSTHSGPRGLTALHVGAINGFSDITRQLLEQKPGIIIKETDENGRSALHYAAYFRRAKMVDLLLRNDPSVGMMIDEDGKTALHIAASNIIPKSIGYLLNRNVSIFPKLVQKGFLLGTVLQEELERYGVKTTYFSIDNGKIILEKISAEVIKEVIGLCPESLELRDKNGQNFLHVAAESGQFFIIEYALTELKIGRILINEKDNNGNTPLHLVLKSRSYKCLEFLIKDNRVNKWPINKDNLSPADMALNNLDKAHGSYREFQREAYESLISSDEANWRSGNGSYAWNGRRLIKEEEERHKSIMLDAAANNKQERDTFEKLSQTHMLVATLIATVTFAAGLTLPGGFETDGVDKGKALLLEKSSFQWFAVSNSMAMILSIMVVGIHYISKLFYLNNNFPVRCTIFMTHLFMCLAFVALLIAFASGSYTVLDEIWASKILFTMFLIICGSLLLSMRRDKVGVLCIGVLSFVLSYYIFKS